MYPGQNYFWEHNANIRRAEENWALDRAFKILEMPPIPEEAFEFIREAQEAAQGLTMANGKETRAKVVAQPEAGARQPAGKTSGCDAVLTDSKQSKVGETVTTVSPDVNKGLAAKLASENIDGNPKKRTKNVWGGETKKGTGEEN